MDITEIKKLFQQRYTERLQTPGVNYRRVPYRFMDILDFEADTAQSKSYKYKKGWSPIVRDSESGMILTPQDVSVKQMIGGDDARSINVLTTFSTANGNAFNFPLLVGNDSAMNYVGVWSSLTAYVVGQTVSLLINNVPVYFICTQNNTNQTPPNTTYRSQTAIYPQNLANFQNRGNTLVVNNDSLIEIDFGFAMDLSQNIRSVTFEIISSINGTILSWQQPAVADLALLFNVISGYKRKVYQASANEILELVVIVDPSAAPGQFTLLSGSYQTYRSAKTLRPNY